MQAAAVTLLLFRHLHFFVLIGDLPQPPTLHIQTRQYYVYPDPLRLTVYGEQGDNLLSTAIGMGTTLGKTLPGGAGDQPARGPDHLRPRLYLVQADPGMNGAIFDCDRPWGVMGSANSRIGVNGPGPQLYFYVPPDCAEFTVGAQSASPNEGGRVVIHPPQGQPAGVLDGELNDEQTLKVAVPVAQRDAIWSLTWGKPETAPAALDDLNFWLEGNLTPLLFPRLEWAQQYGKLLWQRDTAARQAEGP